MDVDKIKNSNEPLSVLIERHGELVIKMGTEAAPYDRRAGNSLAPSADDPGIILAYVVGILPGQ